MGYGRFWLKVADEESKCTPHEFPRFCAKNATVWCVSDYCLRQCSQSNQRSVYGNEYVLKATLCVFVGIAQLVEHPAETDQLTFINNKRHRAFESRKLLLLFSCLIYLFIIHFYFFFYPAFIFFYMFFFFFFFFFFCNSF